MGKTDGSIRKPGGVIVFITIGFADIKKSAVTIITIGGE